MKFLFLWLLFTPLLVAQNNQYSIWVAKSFAGSDAFSSSVHGNLERVEFRYGRLLHDGRIQVRWVSNAAAAKATYPWEVRNGFGCSPVGAEVGWHRYFVFSQGGFLYFQKELFNATRFNFTAQFGAGVRISHFNVGYQFHHLSNANLGDTNPGMNNQMIFVGASL